MITTSTAGQCRILAIDVRPQRIGFAAFENSEHLLDAATRKMKTPIVAGIRFASLITTFRPSILVLRNISLSSSRYRPRTRMFQEMICRFAQRLNIEVVFVSERELRDHFQAYGMRTKHEIATLLANRFPDLAWKLREKRKIYDREAWIMAAFDAAALGMAYSEMSNSVSEEMRGGTLLD